MKITKFPQSCILIESNGTRLLVDPGKVKFDEKFLKFWKTADAILVTHKHGDHYNKDVIKDLGIPIFSTREVQDVDKEVAINIIKQGDNFKVGNFSVTVVKAVHGYIMESGKIDENVGYIIDDGTTKLYITSDSIRFKVDFSADVMFADVAAFDASMNLWGACQTCRDVGAKLLIVAHQDECKMYYEKSVIEDYLKSQGIDYIIPEILQNFEI